MKMIHKNNLIPTTVPIEKNLPVFKKSMKNFYPTKTKNQITLRKVSLPQSDNFDEKIVWLCSSLGFFEDIDKDKIAAAIFKELFLATIKGQVLTSTTIAQRIGMSRGAAINHLNKLHNSGLITKGGKYYFMRQRTMVGIIEEIEDDISHLFSRMKRIAKEIDAKTNQVINI
jgi:predicted transcriptional regulator